MDEILLLYIGVIVVDIALHVLLMKKSTCWGDKMRIFKSMIMVLMATVMICGLALGNYQSVFAQENKDSDSEIISGVVYQFEDKGNYNLYNGEKSAIDDSGTESDGQFSIKGNIGSTGEKNGFPEYSVRGGTLTFSFDYDDGLLRASEDEVHLVDDNGKKVNGTSLNSSIKKGALIVQTVSDMIISPQAASFACP